MTISDETVGNIFVPCLTVTVVISNANFFFNIIFYYDKKNFPCLSIFETLFKFHVKLILQKYKMYICEQH